MNRTIISSIINKAILAFLLLALVFAVFPSNVSAYVPNMSGNDGKLTPVTPFRLYDQYVSEGSVVTVPVKGQGGIPNSGVRAVVVNVTADSPTKNGYLTVFPSGTDIPLASTVNFSANSGAIANQISVDLGTNGSISVLNKFGVTRVVLDVSGYFSNKDGASNLKYNSVGNSRIFDKRVAENSTTNVKIAGRAGIPASNVGAVVVNITAASPTAAGYVIAYPSDSVLPSSSSLNFTSSTGAIANQMIVKLSSTGSINLYNKFGSVRIALDVSGYYSAESGYRYVGLSPTRISDTVYSEGQNQVLDLSGLAGIPSYFVKAVVVNVTAASPTKPGYLSVYPSSDNVPNTSTLNFMNTTAAVANEIITGVNIEGKINIYNPFGSTRVILDVSGYYINSDQLEELPYDSNAIMSSTADIDVIQIANDIQYGPSPSQNFDIYESANHPELASRNKDTIIWFFGGGWSGGDNDLTTPSDKIAKHLAAQYGYKLISANYRLSGEAIYPAQYQDAIAIIKYLKANSVALDIDPGRIIIGGFSAGGDIATMAGHGYDVPEFQPQFLPANISEQSAKVYRIISFATPFDKLSWSNNYFEGLSPINGLNQLLGINDTDAHYDQYVALNSLQYATNDDPPHFTVMCEDDNIIPFSSQYAAMNDIGKRSILELQYCQSFGHASSLGANIPALLDFLK